MQIHATRSTLRYAAICGAILLIATGCRNKGDNTANFTKEINNYYGGHLPCLWPQPVKFPVQVDTSDTSKTSGYDALVDQGLLARTTAEKKVMIVGSKQVSNYDLSEKGRGAWTADVTQPGFGNFCYGLWQVGSIDSATPTNGELGATTQVTYHYILSDPPAWASAPETQTAYPQIHSDLSELHSSKVTFTNTKDGWVLSSKPGEHKTVNNADGRIVE